MMKFIKFTFVGALGTITNLVIFFILSRFALHYMLYSCICFIIALSQNYILNNFFTFQEKALSFKQYLFYIQANIFDMCVKLSVLFIFRTFNLGQFYYKDILSQALGIASAFVVNFLLSKYFVFKKRRSD